MLYHKSSVCFGHLSFHCFIYVTRVKDISFYRNNCKIGQKWSKSYYSNTIEADFILPYSFFLETLAESKCLKPCVRQTMTVSARDPSPHSENVTYVGIDISAEVIKLMEQPNYELFNFIVDVG